MLAPPHETTAKNRVVTTEFDVGSSKLSVISVICDGQGEKRRAALRGETCCSYTSTSSFSVSSQTVQIKPLSAITKNHLGISFSYSDPTKASGTDTMPFTQNSLVSSSTKNGTETRIVRVSCRSDNYGVIWTEILSSQTGVLNLVMQISDLG